MNLYAIEVDKLVKRYGSINAVDGISFTVKEGEIFGLLGPNGAGKTTTIKVIVTLAKPTAGSVSVFGIDVCNSPQKVREMVGFVPQSISVDGDLTGYENLLIFSKLSYVGKKEREERIKFAIEYMGLSKVADKLVKYYSGGMMRRLEVAQALVNRPKLLILDEPSIGLDPASKRQVWDYLKQLNEEFKTTILLTTHDMNEADELCDRIAIINSGKIAVIGAPDELKDSVGAEIITIKLSTSHDNLMEIPDDLGIIISRDNNVVKIAAKDIEKKVPRIIQYINNMGIEIESISVNVPTLDDVFMKYAGIRLEESLGHEGARATRRIFVRRAR